jgi:tRNA pseudouridine55 synthase
VSQRRRHGRDISGVLLLDKPAGITSNLALQKVKRLFNASKAGHTGSLDPIATGLLPICLGEATKMSSFVLDADKGYRTTVKLGVRTSTGDCEGEAIETRPVPALTLDQIESVLARFRGPIEQVPPMFSALKREGQPLYRLAHRGIEVEREARSVVIHRLELLDLRSDELDLEVLCSKGTYIRTLAEDIGEVLGCGGHVSALRRTLAGPFTLDQAHTLDQLSQIRNESFAALDACLLPVESALIGWPDVTLSDDLAFHLLRGHAVLVPRLPQEGFVKLYGGGRFLGVGHILDDGRVAPKRLIAA